MQTAKPIQLIGDVRAAQLAYPKTMLQTYLYHFCPTLPRQPIRTWQRYSVIAGSNLPFWKDTDRTPSCKCLSSRRMEWGRYGIGAPRCDLSVIRKRSAPAIILGAGHCRGTPPSSRSSRCASATTATSRSGSFSSTQRCTATPYSTTISSAGTCTDRVPPSTWL